MSKIGIGIVTYNRLSYMQRVVEGVRANTTSDYELVVADDGSTDGTNEWCLENDVRVVSGENGGVCWNKNRALFALQELGCDPILLLEDDCVPIRIGWDWDWRIATALFGHVAFAHPKLAPWLISGTGTPVDPFVNNKATAQCSSASGLALSQVGFFDTRFKGYGVGHAEWTTRMKRVGYGFRKAIDKEGREVKANLYIEGGLVGDDAPTFKDKANIARNEILFTELKKEAPYRHPWSTDAERLRFLGEQKKAGIGSSRYQALNSSDEDRDARINARYLRPYGRAFRNVFGDVSSFLRRSGWLTTLALDLPLYGDELVPVFTYPMLDLLHDRVKPNHRVLIIRADEGSIWWSKRVEQVRIAKSDIHKIENLKSIWPSGGASLEYIDLDSLESVALLKFDIIVIGNGISKSEESRIIDLIDDHGILILGDDNHRGFRDLKDKLESTGCRKLVLRGPAPTRIGNESSSLYYKSSNCIGL